MDVHAPHVGRFEDRRLLFVEIANPIVVTLSSRTLLKPGIARARPDQHRPVTAASAIPSRKPLRVVSGVLKSP
jgi:hypothetical protein